nr:hypothetical protein CFP56_11201 [Quercus suber]
MPARQKKTPLRGAGKADDRAGLAKRVIHPPTHAHRPRDSRAPSTSRAESHRGWPMACRRATHARRPARPGATPRIHVKVATYIHQFASSRATDGSRGGRGKKRYHDSTPCNLIPVGLVDRIAEEFWSTHVQLIFKIYRPFGPESPSASPLSFQSSGNGFPPSNFDFQRGGGGDHPPCKRGLLRSLSSLPHPGARVRPGDFSAQGSNFAIARRQDRERQQRAAGWVSSCVELGEEYEINRIDLAPYRPMATSDSSTLCSDHFLCLQSQEKINMKTKFPIPVSVLESIRCRAA